MRKISLWLGVSGSFWELFCSLTATQWKFHLSVLMKLRKYIVFFFFFSNCNSWYLHFLSYCSFLFFRIIWTSYWISQTTFCSYFILYYFQKVKWFQPLSFSSFCFTFFFFLSDAVSFLSTCEVLRTHSSLTSGISYQVSFLLHSYPLSLFGVLNIFCSFYFSSLLWNFTLENLLAHVLFMGVSM